MILRFRYLYRRLLLAFIPARAYVLKAGISSAEIKVRLLELINPDRLYFIYPTQTHRLFSGKFGTNSFVAIKNNPGGLQRPIKVKGQFIVRDEQIYCKVTLSNPFSLINIFLLGLLYFLLIIVFRVFPFGWWPYNVLLYVLPLLITYLLTNISFQRIYRSEKSRFFKLFEGRRLSEEETKKLLQS